MKCAIGKYCLVSALAVLYMHNACALEGGASSYPLGVVTVMSGAMGAPGDTMFYTYNKLIDISSIRDNGGDKTFPKARGKIHAHALRVVHTLDGVEFLGGNVSLQAAASYIFGHMDIPSLGPFGRDSSYGTGDPLFGAIVNWQSPTYMQSVELDFIVPWGTYHKGELVNAGNNAKAWYATYSFTWFPTQQLELSSKISVNYSFENPSTHYTSGVQLAADYGVNYHVTQNWLVGVGGYVTTQLNDDKSDDEKVGNRTRNIKIGPQVGYAHKDWGVVAAYQYDVYARNTAASNIFMLNGFFKF